MDQHLANRIAWELEHQAQGNAEKAAHLASLFRALGRRACEHDLTCSKCRATCCYAPSLIQPTPHR